MIDSGEVLVSGTIATNTARLVDAGEPIVLSGPPPRFVSRGGEKLEAALTQFAIETQDKRAIDIGASTGGFTDCLLQHGAKSVVALDVGHGQMHERMRADPRVDVRERTNIRNVTLSDFDDLPFDLITIDVSFISLRTIAEATIGLAAPGADVVALIKPQFEAGRAEVSKGKGVVTGREIWARVLTETVSAMNDAKAATMGLMVSPLLGAEGNVEFLGWFRVDATNPHSVDFEAMLEPALEAAEELKGIPK